MYIWLASELNDPPSRVGKNALNRFRNQLLRSALRISLAHCIKRRNTPSKIFLCRSVNPLRPHTPLFYTANMASKDGKSNTLDEGIYGPIRVREEREGVA